MDHKQRKKLIFERNRRNQRIFQMVEEQRQIAEAAAEALEFAPSPPPPATGEPAWSARTQEIRNRLTNKKRMSRDRWNRFAGTADGGGMGR